MIRSALTIAALALGLATPLPAAATTLYHVRPLINITGETIDGLKENADTAFDVSFGDAARTGRASADLETGELAAFDFISGTGVALVALAELSETFTVRNGAGTRFSFDFAFDGTLEGDAKMVPGGELYSLLTIANLAVFAPGVADWDTWFDLATTTDSEIFYDAFSFSVVDPLAPFFVPIDETLSFETTLESHEEHFHVFARIQIAALANTPQTATLDFENTGSLGFSGDEAVEVFSMSGVFPGTSAVPEPGGALLVAVGLAGACALRGYSSASRSR